MLMKKGQVHDRINFAIWRYKLTFWELQWVRYFWNAVRERQQDTTLDLNEQK